MPPIASNPVWFENLELLVDRWLALQPPAVRDGIDGGAAAVALRSRDRARRVLAQVKIGSAFQISSAREWETRWAPADRWRELEAAIGRYGWRVERIRGEHRGPADLALAVQSGDERPAIAIDDRSLSAMVSCAAANGIEIEFTVEDAAVIELAGELYRVACEKLGAMPPAWVDDIGRCIFQQSALGLPFSPLLFEVTPAPDHLRPRPPH